MTDASSAENPSNTTVSGVDAGGGAGSEGYMKTASAAYDAALEVIASVEPRVADATRKELADQRASLKLIASENYASPAVLLAMGTWFSDKYAEGTVGHRFYAGCQNVDTVEALAAEHARELFGAPYAYAQPHSGIDANLVAFWSILAHHVETPALEKLGARSVSELSEADWEQLRNELGNQRLLGMALDAGGHLTHGFRPNISGKMFHQQQYGTDPETQLLDYDAVAAKAREFRPLVIVAGYSAYPRRIDFAKMREIADEVGAVLMVDMAHFAGLVAGKVFTGNEDPVPHAHVTTTTTHKSLRGPRGGLVLAQEEYAADVDRGCPMVLGGPLSHVMAAKAVALAEARQPSFRSYAQAIADNAKSLAEGFLSRGATLVTGGTDNHIVLLDVRSFGLTGRQAESALLDAGVVTNRNAVPQDPNGAWYTTGVRLGTPALTSRGFGAAEFDKVAELIVDVLSNTQPGTTKAGAPSKATYSTADGVAERVHAQAEELLDNHPLYPGLELT
jgi:glycine hydroxymethyltransferase